MVPLSHVIVGYASRERVKAVPWGKKRGKKPSRRRGRLAPGTVIRGHKGRKRGCERPLYFARPGQRREHQVGSVQSPPTAIETPQPAQNHFAKVEATIQPTNGATNRHHDAPRAQEANSEAQVQRREQVQWTAVRGWTPWPHSVNNQQTDITSR